MIFACSEPRESVKLEAGTPAYQMAKDLSQVVPYLDPDSNKILASTNAFQVSTGEIIQTMQSSLGTRMEQLKKMKPEQIDKIIKDNAASIAEKNLLLDEVLDADISVSQEEVDSVMAIQYGQVGGKERFLQMLERNKVGIEIVEDNTRTNLLIQHYIDEILARDIEVSEAEILGEYEKSYTGDKSATVRHILLITKGKSEDEKKKIFKKMEGILAEARSGKDFADLAKKYSEDPGSKDKGGIYKDFEKGAMVKPFEDAAFSIPIGEISDIVETGYGYHILKIIDRKKSTQAIDEVRQEIIDKLKSPQKESVFNTHLQKLKEEADFKVIEG
jgi:parvulin-like peptidyl-prolyl isomerase